MKKMPDFIEVYDNAITSKDCKNVIKDFESNPDRHDTRVHVKGRECTTVYRAFNNKYVDDLLRKIRFKYGVNLIKKGSDGAKECIKALKNKENLGMLIDQKMNDGLPISFFNKLAMTAPAIAKFSLKFKCQIIPALCVRTKGVRYKIEYFKPIKYSFLKKLGTEEKIMLYLNKIIEGWILKYPEQWIWVHDRWKIKD